MPSTTTSAPGYCRLGAEVLVGDDWMVAGISGKTLAIANTPDGKPIILRNCESHVKKVLHRRVLAPLPSDPP